MHIVYCYEAQYKSSCQTHTVHAHVCEESYDGETPLPLDVPCTPSLPQLQEDGGEASSCKHHINQLIAWGWFDIIDIIIDSQLQQCGGELEYT